MDIAHEHIFVLDQECATMPQTPDDEQPRIPVGSSIESSMESREGTPMSPNIKFFNSNRSLSGVGSGGGTSGSLSPGIDVPSRKSKYKTKKVPPPVFLIFESDFVLGSQGSQGSTSGSPKNITNGSTVEAVINFKT